jgi:hypothetical protein
MRISLNHATPKEVQILSPRSAFLLQMGNFTPPMVQWMVRRRAGPAQ